MLIARNFCALLLAITLTGCAVNFQPGVGSEKIADATQESLEKQFPIGTATRDDVAVQLGAPPVNTVAGSYEIWKYEYLKQTTVAVILVATPIRSTKQATFYFDNSSGILKKIEFAAQ